MLKSTFFVSGNKSSIFPKDKASHLKHYFCWLTFKSHCLTLQVKRPNQSIPEHSHKSWNHKSWNHKQKLQKCSNNARYLIYIKVSFDIFLPSKKSYKIVLFHVQFSILFAIPSDKHILWYFSYKYVCTASIPFSLDRLQECWLIHIQIYIFIVNV